MGTLREPIPHGTLARLTVLTALAIAYESLIPFEYRAVPFDHAVSNFVHLRWEPMGAGDRGDWLGNVALYLPLGFLACGALSRRSALFALGATIVLGALLAVGIEFAQTWASPRTVRLNDIVAEIIGTIVGAGAWALFGPRLVSAVQATLSGGATGMRAALALYLLAYIFIMLFPFDFLLSPSEIHRRAADPAAFVVIPAGMRSLPTLARFTLKAALMLPFGAAIRIGWQRGPAVAAIWAVALSLMVELAHWFEYTAQSDAANIVVAATGAAIGNAIAGFARVNGGSAVAVLRSGAWILAIVYLLALPVLRGWRPHLADMASMRQTLADLHWMPFYYHYFTSKVRAFVSLLTVTASFLPVGAFFWAIRLRDPASAGDVLRIWPSAVVAGLLSVGVEAGALLTAGNRPDPTNILIAMVAALIAQRGCEWLARAVWSAPSPEGAVV